MNSKHSEEELNKALRENLEKSIEIRALKNGLPATENVDSIEVPRCSELYEKYSKEFSKEELRTLRSIDAGQAGDQKLIRQSLIFIYGD